MRKSSPPFVVLSKNGNMAATMQGTLLHLITIQNSTVTTLQLAHEGRVVALSPQGVFCVVADHNWLSLLRCGPKPTLLATVPLPARMFRVSVGDKGLVAGALNFSTAHNTLYLWRGTHLIPLLPGDGEALGEVAPYHLLLDETTNRVLVWGLIGPGAYSGEGERFVRLFELTTTGLQTLWKGEGIPAQTNGFLMPLARGNLGVYDREQLSILPAITESGQTIVPLTTYTLGNLEKTATSPDGTHLVWLWSNDLQHYQIRVIQLNDATVITDASIDTIGWFPAIAVNNQGQATLIYSEKPHRVLAFMVENNQLMCHTDVSIIS